MNTYGVGLLALLFLVVATLSEGTNSSNTNLEESGDPIMKSSEGSDSLFTKSEDTNSSLTKGSTCMYPGSRINSKTNLDPRLTEYVQNVVAEYECDEGFTLYGPKTRICQEPGEWSGHTPFCGLRLPSHMLSVSSPGVEEETLCRDRNYSTCAVIHPRQYSELNVSLTFDLNVQYDVRMIELYADRLIADRKSLLVKASDTTDGLLTAKEVEAPLPPGQSPDNNHLTLYKVFLPENVRGRFMQIDIMGNFRNESYGICEIFTVVEYGTPENFCVNEDFGDAKHYQIGDTCYQFTNVRETSYEHAQLYCKKRHAEVLHNIDDGLLVNIRTATRDHFAINQVDGDYVWLGGKKEGSTWKWDNGEKIDKRVLFEEEESSDYEDRNCLVMNKTNYWLLNPHSCSPYDGSMPYIVCQHNRTRCGHPPQNDRALMTISGEDKIGRMAQFSCPEGYVVHGAESVQCGHDGFWNHQSPVCVKTLAPKKTKGSGVLAGMLAGVFLGAIILAMCVFFIKRHLARRRKENISGKVTKLSSRRLDSTDRLETEPCLTKQEIIEEEEVKPLNSELDYADVPDVVQQYPVPPLRKSLRNPRTRGADEGKSRRSVRFSDQITIRKRSADGGPSLHMRRAAEEAQKKAEKVEQDSGGGEKPPDTGQPGTQQPSATTTDSAQIPPQHSQQNAEEIPAVAMQQGLENIPGKNQGLPSRQIPQQNSGPVVGHGEGQSPTAKVGPFSDEEQRSSQNQILNTAC